MTTAQIVGLVFVGLCALIWLGTTLANLSKPIPPKEPLAKGLFCARCELYFDENGHGYMGFSARSHGMTDETPIDVCPTCRTWVRGWIKATKNTGECP